MLKLFLAFASVAAPALGETLLSGSIYFDSENTFLEVQDLIQAKDTEALARLFTRNHISDKLPKDLDIVLLRSGPEPDSQAEFHLPNDPTTYWTYRKYVKGESPKITPSPSPGPNSNLPPNLPSSLISPVIPDPLNDPPPRPADPPSDPADPPPGRQHKLRTAFKHYALHRHYHRVKHLPTSTLSFWQKVKRGFAQIF